MAVHFGFATREAGMASLERGTVPAWYWIVAVVALLWEAAGCFAYMKQSPAAPAMPIWAWSAFAVAVWAGLAGAVLLLVRMRLARIAFALSLAGVAVQLCWTLLGSHADKAEAKAAGATAASGAGAFLFFVLVVAGILLWFADWTAKRGWLR